MADEIVVRFVPKTRSTAPRLNFSFESLATSPREFLPDPGRASSALSWFAGRGNVDATTTDGNRLEVAMAQGDFAKLFDTKLHPGKFTKRTNGRLTSRESFSVPAKSLPVP